MRVSTAEPLSPQVTLDYLVELGSTLMSAGCPVYRLEELLIAVAKLQGFEADIFAVPTGLFVTLKTPGGKHFFQMVRVSQWTTDLHLLGELDVLVNDVANGLLTVPEALERIRALKAAPPQWSKRAQLLASTGAAAGSVVSLGGTTWTDSLMAGLGGALLALVLQSTKQQPGMRVLENFLGGLIAGVAALVASVLWPGQPRDALVLAVIIPLLPGLVLTTGLAELTYRNLVSGSARLFHAAVTLLSLVFGIGAVVALEARFGLQAGRALVREPAGFLFHLAALAAAANAYARITSRPAQLFLMPGMLLLVPGALGFRGLEALLRGDMAGGTDQLSNMLLVSGALVTGLLVANVVVPPQKVL